MRENPDGLQAPVNIAMSEQNLRRKFNLQTGRNDRVPEPMEVDDTRPSRCQLCRCLGYGAGDCRSLYPECAKAVGMTKQFSTRQGQPSNTIVYFDLLDLFRTRS